MNKALLAELLPIFVQFGLTAVQDVIVAIRNGAQNQGEADADYITRRIAEIKANTAAIDAQDADIQK